MSGYDTQPAARRGREPILSLRNRLLAFTGPFLLGLGMASTWKGPIDGRFSLALCFAGVGTNALVDWRTARAGSGVHR